MTTTSKDEGPLSEVQRLCTPIYPPMNLINILVLLLAFCPTDL